MKESRKRRGSGQWTLGLALDGRISSHPTLQPWLRLGSHIRKSREDAMSSTPNGTSPRVHYQTQCIRNPRLDDVVYAGVASTQQASFQLRRAYIVGAVLFAVSLAAAVVPVVYVASTGSATSRRAGDGDWTVCWPCRQSNTGMCCEALKDTDFRCDTDTAVGYCTRPSFDPSH